MGNRTTLVKKISGWMDDGWMDGWMDEWIVGDGWIIWDGME